MGECPAAGAGLCNNCLTRVRWPRNAILTLNRGGRNSSHITLVFYLDHWFIRHSCNDDIAMFCYIGFGSRIDKYTEECEVMVCCVTMSHYRLSFLLTRTSLKLFSHLNCFSPFNYHRPSFDTILFGTKKLRFCYKKGEGEKSRAMIKTALPWIYWERNSKHIRLHFSVPHPSIQIIISSLLPLPGSPPLATCQADVCAEHVW